MSLLEKINIMLKFSPDTDGTEYERLSAHYWLTFFIIAFIIGVIFAVYKIIS